MTQQELLNYQQLSDLFSQLHTEVEKPLLTFRGDNFKKDLKKYDHHIADLRKQLASRYASVEKVPSLICFSLLANVSLQIAGTRKYTLVFVYIRNITS